jgi:regulator of ribosome biosynthesis
MDLNTLIFHNAVAINSIKEEDLLQMSLDSTTQVIHSLLKLPTVKVGESLEIELPEYDQGKYPRSRKLPAQKPLTKWENFAKKKGITSSKSSLSKYDEQGELVASHGYKKKKESRDNLQDWCIEVPNNVEISKERDMYSIRNEEAKTKKTKIQSQQEKNLSTRKASVVEKFLHSAKSTASLGKFDKNLKNQIKAKRGKRSFISNISKDPTQEVNSNLAIFNKI